MKKNINLIKIKIYVYVIMFLRVYSVNIFFYVNLLKINIKMIVKNVIYLYNVILGLKRFLGFMIIFINREYNVV